jgi:hypothetical protein
VVSHQFKPSGSYYDLRSSSGNPTTNAVEEKYNSLESNLFVEDDWKINNQFQVNMGLRVSSFLSGDKNYWNIEPWRVTKTRFRMILADMRKRHNTNGLIECAMMDVFFEQENMSKFHDANFVMMSFFHRYGQLYQYVISRNLALTEAEVAEKIERQREVAERSWRRLNGPLDSLEVEDPAVVENRKNYAYYKQQRELDLSAGIITAEEFASALETLDLEYQPR